MRFCSQKTTRHSKVSIEYLPNDLLGEIFLYLDRRDLSNCCQVSSLFHKVANENHIWYSLYRRNHGTVDAWENTNWKSFLTKDVNKYMRIVHNKQTNLFDLFENFLLFMLFVTAVGFSLYSIYTVLTQYIWFSSFHKVQGVVLDTLNFSYTYTYEETHYNSTQVHSSGVVLSDDEISVFKQEYPPFTNLNVFVNSEPFSFLIPVYLSKPYDLLLGSQFFLIFSVCFVLLISTVYDFLDIDCVTEQQPVYVYELKRRLYRVYQTHTAFSPTLKFALIITASIILILEYALFLHYVIIVFSGSLIDEDRRVIVIIGILVITISLLGGIFDLGKSYREMRVPWKEPEIWKELPGSISRGIQQKLYFRQRLKFTESLNVLQCKITVNCFQYEHNPNERGIKNFRRSVFYTLTCPCEIISQNPLLYVCKDFYLHEMSPATSLSRTLEVFYLWTMNIHVKYENNEYISYDHVINVN